MFVCVHLEFPYVLISIKSEVGFEPTNNGFAIRPLGPLGYPPFMSTIQYAGKFNGAGGIRTRVQVNPRATRGVRKGVYPLLATTP